MLLNKEKVLSNLNAQSLQAIGDLVHFESVDSTSQWLLNQIAQGNAVNNQVCLAESQTAGAGRNGKAWVSSDSSNILMSIVHHFELPMATLSGLSLAVGISIVNALEEFGVTELSLKWPNDVYLNGDKLAGILIQVQSHSHIGHWAVIGIGINVELSDQDKQQINQNVADLSSFCIGESMRDKLIAKVLDHLLLTFDQFANFGLGHFQHRWNQLDFLKDQSVTLYQGKDQITGRYLGINQVGAIQIKLQIGVIKEYYVGDLSVRKNTLT